MAKRMQCVSSNLMSIPNPKAGNIFLLMWFQNTWNLSYIIKAGQPRIVFPGCPVCAVCAVYDAASAGGANWLLYRSA